VASASPDLLRSLSTSFIDALMSAEADAVCPHAWRYTATPLRRANPRPDHKRRIRPPGGSRRRAFAPASRSSAAQATGSPAVGARCLTTRRIGGANRTSTSELVHVDPPRTWRVRGIGGPIRAAVDVLVEPVTDSRSRLTISVDFTGQGIGKILVPMVIREARQEMPDNMSALKQRLEAGKPSTAQ
jgi:Polyketide cyclase / dehydrase and lipid transport